MMYYVYVNKFMKKIKYNENQNYKLSKDEYNRI